MRLLSIMLMAALAAGCSEVNLDGPTGKSVITGTGRNVIEFRVSGNANAVRIRHSNSVDGLTQVTAVLPFTVSFRTNQDSLFVSLEVTPTGYPVGTLFPFLSAQIFGNGVIFRETNSSDNSVNTISVSGTWRR